ncbi:MAG TPA: hypothetical protein VG096_19960 [Bryobacteraceae bacterium]|nr:hypothetical protein [Bryobacteraceae bacterium]
MKLKTLALRSVVLAGLLSAAGTAAIAQNQANPCDPQGLSRGNIVYDSNLGVCWLADANLAAKPSMRAALGVSGINPNGTMEFQTAQNWVAALNGYDGGAGYLGHNNWQLPVTPITDGSCASTGTGGGSFGPGCTGSAMGNLYHDSLALNYPNSDAPGFGVPVSVFFQNLKLSYYWTQTPNGGGQEVYSFSNGMQGGVTTEFPYYYALPMVPGPIVDAPHCHSGSGMVPYTTGPAAGKAVFDCATKYTWAADGNLAAQENFGITGDVTIVSNRGVTFRVPAIDGGAMLFSTANQWITAMKNSGYAGSNAWQLPPDHTYLEQFAADLGMVPGDVRLMFTGRAGSFQDLQPFYYWGCQEGQTGVTESPCTNFAPPDGSQQMQWTFNFDDGFQGTAETSQQFFVMVYFPLPAVPACPTPLVCCAQAGGYWSNDHCQ